MTEYERNVLNNIKYSELESVILTTRYTDFACFSVLQNFMIYRVLFLVAFSCFLIFIDSVSLYAILKEFVQLPQLHSIYVFLIGFFTIKAINSFGYSPDPEKASCLEIYQMYFVFALCMCILTASVAVMYYIDGKLHF